MKLSAFGVKQENQMKCSIRRKIFLILAMHVLRVHFYSINISKILSTDIYKKNLFKILLRIKGKFNKRKPAFKENTNHFYHYTNFFLEKK